MRIPTYLFQSKKNIFYFRIRIPKDLRAVIKGDDIRKSLRTTSLTTAIKLGRFCFLKAEKTFEKIRFYLLTAENYTANPDAVRIELDRTKILDIHGTGIINNDALQSSIFGESVDGLSPFYSLSQTQNPQLFQVPQTPQIPVQPLLATQITNESIQPVVETTQAGQHITLRELIRLYISEVTSQRGELIADGIEKNLKRFMEIVTNKPVNQYTVADRILFRDTLLMLPKRLQQSKYKHKSVEEILNTPKSEAELISKTTVNMRISEVGTLFNWAETNGVINHHPFKKATLKTQISEDAERSAVSDEDIRKIIAQLPQSYNAPSKYWVPLIACFTGMRQSEIAQLDGDDIIDVKGTWCIDVNDRGDKRLKNLNARRIIPLHEMILKAGLVEFAETRRGQKMFHDIQPYRGKYGHQISKNFARYLEKIGTNRDGQTFHGLRHSVITKLWSAGIPEPHVAAVAGHQRGESESYTRYAKKTDLKPLLAAIAEIDYGTITLTAWNRFDPEPIDLDNRFKERRLKRPVRRNEIIQNRATREALNKKKLEEKRSKAGIKAEDQVSQPLPPVTIIPPQLEPERYPESRVEFLESKTEASQKKLRVVKIRKRSEKLD